MARNVSLMIAMVLCTCLALLTAGCGGGGESPTGPATSPSSQEPATSTGTQTATLNDVLKLTNDLYLVYTANNGPNTVDYSFMCGGVTWEGRSFSADHRGQVEERLNVYAQQHLKIDGTVAEDGKSIETMTVDVETLGPSEGRRYTEQFTWKNIPVDSLYATPSRNWQEEPRVSYKVNVGRAEAETHVQDWTSSYEDSVTPASPLDQAGRVDLLMPAENATLDIKVSFSRK